MDLSFAQRWASKGAEKWRKRLAAEVDRAQKRKPISESEDSDSSSDSDSEADEPKSRVQKPKPICKPAPAPLKKKAEVVDLLDFASEKELSTLDSFLADDAPPVTRERKSSARKESNESKKGGSSGGGRDVKSERERSDPAAAKSKRGSGDNAAANPSLDKEACDERIRRRTEEKDRQRAAEALAKLEAICGGGGEDTRWGGVNPPTPSAGAGADSDSDEAAARRERRAQRRREKDARREAASGGGSGGGGGGGGGSAPGNPAPRGESTMQRLRREAEEAKERQRREKQEHMAKFSGQVPLDVRLGCICRGQAHDVVTAT